ncbi:metallophosphoesterase [Pedobacter sp.]|uniref:metallophosphoesterase n=1 Tax=Pedobacter sp. TaxID=1411316 RepID=UPI003D7FBF04
MRQLLVIWILLSSVVPVWAQQQDTLLARLIFIGDAGQVDRDQTLVIKDAALKIIKGKTKVIYLGDNVYPDGMGLPGSKEEQQTQDILRSQYLPMRNNGAPVYFIPGNHDWDHSGKLGLAKIKQQDSFLQEQKDSQLKLLPPNGCPDPIEMKITDEVMMIIIDSEWWLFPYAKENPAGGCSCNSEQSVLEKLAAIVNKNKDKTILLASHHPFQSYGKHGLRWFFPSPEDLRNKKYKSMVNRINKAMSGSTRVIHVSGHDHGLQYIKGNHIQVVSGSGAKRSSVIKGENSLFADSRHGFVLVDIYPGQRLKFRYFVLTAWGVEELFTTEINYHASDHRSAK